ncbi:uncharacterized protein A4U43_C04F18150 [Asparagus officinalis]|uniref:LOB domain-containing protein n=1 Tax=Asparagus officinalis TaxID=4686 RepID=A0A5P1F2D4_ASPOF|nr:uncharacterized protein A4U43_C04F18150 [Asparagus officinalis]
MSSNSSAGSPCGACKFLRRKCASDCVFAPYFSNEHGSSSLRRHSTRCCGQQRHVPQHERCEAVVTIAYEAQARVRDPVYGCVSHIFALQQQGLVPRLIGSPSGHNDNEEAPLGGSLGTLHHY